MSAAISGTLHYPGYRFAHPGYTCSLAIRSVGYAALTHPTHFTHFASPSDFSALPLSSLSAFMNSAKPAESR
jgi:hypothetical protein